MSRHVDHLDRLVALARDAGAPPLDDLATHRLVERALANASLSSPSPLRSVLRWLWLPATAACAAMVLWLVFASTHQPELSTVTLHTGDRLVSSHGARFDIDELTPVSRRFRMRAGTMLFDVARVADPQRFEVTTPHVVVIARGTVFSITTDERASSVHVYEGAVDVVHAGTSHRVGAGHSWPANYRGASQLASAAAEALHTRTSPTPHSSASADGSATPAAAALSTAGSAASNSSTRSASTSAPSTAGASTATPAATAASAARSPTRSSAGTSSPTSTTSRASSERDAAAREVDLDQLLARARAHVVAGRFTEALDDVKRAKALNAATTSWFFVEGDALRGLGRAEPAAIAFETAARMLSGGGGSARVEAAYLRFHELRDGAQALVVLDVHRVDESGSSLEERGLALRVQILVGLGRHDDAGEHAQRYLARFPRGGLRAFMLATARRGSGSDRPAAR